MSPKQKGMLAVIIFIVIILLPVTVAIVREYKQKHERGQQSATMQTDTATHK